MPLSFLNPGLLFGGLAAAVPLILHLLRNRRVRRVPFSDLRFLRDVEMRRSRTAGLRRWLLLLMRMLAILLIVVAAARPRLGGLAPAAGDRVSLLVALDASASMQAADATGRSRFEQAVITARDLTRTLPEGSEVQWLRAGAATETVFGAWLPSGLAAEAVPASLHAGDGTVAPAPMLRAAAAAARDAERPPLVVVITDDQAVEGDDDELLAALRSLTDVGVQRLEVVPVGEQVDDGAVMDVELPVRTVLEGETVEIRARVRPARDGQVVRLELDDHVVGEAVTDEAAAGETIVTFAVTAPEAGTYPGRIVMRRDRAPADDQRSFVLAVRKRLRVLLAHGEGRDGWRFLAHALDPSFAGSEPGGGAVVLDVVAATAWSGGDLESYDVLVLVDPEPLGRDRLSDLQAWLQRGGGCWLVAGDPARGEDLREYLLPAVAPPLVPEGFHVRGDDGVERLVVTRPVHDLLAGLPDDALATLGEAEWSRGWRFRQDGVSPVASLEGGDPMLIAGANGDGRWLVLASGLHQGATNLTDNAMFPPLAQRAVVWLGVGRGGGPVLRAGEPLRLSLAAVAGRDLSGPLEFVHDPADGSRESSREPATLTWSGGLPSVDGPADPGAGVWRLTDGITTLESATTVVPAVESGPAPGGDEAFSARLAQAGFGVDHHLAAGADNDLSTLLAGRDLAPWCFLAAALLLLLETWYSRGEGPAGGVSRT